MVYIGDHTCVRDESVNSVLATRNKTVVTLVDHEMARINLTCAQ